MPYPSQGAGMSYQPPIPTTLSEDRFSFPTACKSFTEEYSAGRATPTMNLMVSDTAEDIEKEESLDDFNNCAGEITNRSVLGRTTSSEALCPLEDSTSFSADCRNQRERKLHVVTIGQRFLVALTVWLAAIGIVEAGGKDQPIQSPRPTTSSTKSPTNEPTNPRPVTYVPGNLTREEVGLLLSEGLRARIIAKSGEPVDYHNGSESREPFHGRPDFGATFEDTRPFNTGGWVYVSNSEIRGTGKGGVGSITFDRNGNVIDYRMVLVNTTMNCGGGKTPWETWVSCEEVEYGEIYQVDPFGEIEAEKTTIGSQLGKWESFAYDVRDPKDPKFFATEDHEQGTVRRFRPEKSMIDWDNPWDILHVDGKIDYLILRPNKTMIGGTFKWVDDLEQAKNNSVEYYPSTEGIHVYGGQMYLVCKGIKQLFTFDLDEMTYFNHSTVSGLFDGEPDSMQRLILDDGDSLLYFTEEEGVYNGVHARDTEGRLFTVLESHVYPDETTGLAFSPDAKHMYVAYQKTGILFDIWREDGLALGGTTLNVKYHKM